MPRAGRHRLRRLPQAALVLRRPERQRPRDALKAVAGVAAAFRAAVDELFDANQAVDTSHSSPATRSCCRSTTPTSPPPTRPRRSGRAARRLPARAEASGASASRRCRQSVRRLAPMSTFAQAMLGMTRRCCMPLADTAAVRRSTTWPRWRRRAFGAVLLARHGQRQCGFRCRRRADTRLRRGRGKQAARTTRSPGDPISGIWSGYLEAPENGFYNFASRPTPARP